MSGAEIQELLMDTSGDPLLATVLRYSTPLALLGIVVALGFIAWALSL